MYYQIYVSLNDVLLFSTAPDLITKEKDFQKVINIIEKKFLKEEGYDIIAVQYNCISKIL